MILALRLLMTPCLIAVATLAGRRWGPGISGWLIGFPLTSAPVSVILALQYGRTFAAQAAIGNIGGLASICAFSLTYSLVARKRNWLASVALSSMAFLLVTFAWSQYSLSLLPTFGITVLAIGLLLWLLPSRAVSLSATRPPGWDLPARMVIATTFVLVLTGSASALGPQLSGLITPFPLFATVLAAFAHEQQGPAAAVQVLRGMALSLFGVAGFFLIVGGLLPSLGMVWTYLLATIVIVSLNSFSLRSDRRRRIP